MPRVTRRLALGAILVLAALPMAAPVAAKDPAKAEHDRIVAYWTPARMASAIPRDFVKAGGKFEPMARPGGGGGGGARDRRIVDPGRTDPRSFGEGLLHAGLDQVRVLGLGRERHSGELLARADRWPLRL